MEILKEICKYENLINGIKRIKKASGWKKSVQSFLCHASEYINNIQEKILNETYEPNKGYSFKLIDHGRARIIRALISVDMMVQHSICNSILFPRLLKYIIHDNGASVKGKGISFTRRRFEQHIHQFYRKHGCNGYILLIDFSKYFDNIQHQKLLDMINKKIKNEKFFNLLKRIFKRYEIDVSYSDDDNLINKIFNSVEYEKIPKSSKTKKKFMRKSLGIGSPISQISGIFFPYKIDNYCKIVKRCKYYGVYMDDRYCIHENKEFLKQLLKEIEIIASSLGIFINKKKTQIIKLSHGFTFLKIRYILTDSGKLIRRIPHSVVTRQRRKIKILAKKAKNKEMTIGEFENQYKSWRNDKKHYHAFYTLKNIDTLFLHLRNDIKRRNNQ